MKVRWTWFWVSASLFAGLMLAGCQRSTAPVAPRAGLPLPAAPGQPPDEFVVGPGVTYANLTLFPITSRTPRPNDRLITLDEGLAAGTVEVREVGASGAAINPNADPFGEAPAPRQTAAEPFGDPPAQTPAEDPFAEAPAQPRADDPFADTPVDEPVAQSLEVNPPQPANPDDDPFAGQQSAQDPFGPGNQVNKVLVFNRSGKPLYLMPGEIILGGDQDRTIGQELVIAPSDKPVEVDVFCVEHGRWGGKGRGATVAQLQALSFNSVDLAMAPADQDRFATAAASRLEAQALEADQGKFVASAGALSKSARLATQRDKSQSKVWDEVAVANAKSGVKIESGAFTGQYVEAAAAERLTPYLEKLTKQIADEPQVVGVVVAIDGKVESFDVFESTPLFRKLWPKLLKSYAVDAANAENQRGPDAAPIVPCPQEIAAQFVKDAIAADVTGQEQSGELAIEQRDSEKVLLFTARDSTQRPYVTSAVPVDGAFNGGGLGGGGLGGSVHGFGAAK